MSWTSVCALFITIGMCVLTVAWVSRESEEAMQSAQTDVEKIAAGVEHLRLVDAPIIQSKWHPQTAEQRAWLVSCAEHRSVVECLSDAPTVWSE